MEIDADADIHLGDGSEETAPPPLCASQPVFDFQFHPTGPFLAAGLINGGIEIHEFQKTQTRSICTLPGIHGAAIRSMEFTEDGRHLVSVGSDKRINVLECETRKNLVTIDAGKRNPHKHGIASVNICSETLVATGDDDGLIAIWDMRQQKPAHTWHEHGDYIGQMLFFSEVDQLISCSGDTTLGVFDLRANAVIDFSEPRKDELCSLAFIPATNDIVCGTPTGTLPIWKYGSWTRPYDVHDKHPKETDALVTYNDNIILTGAGDGVVRVLQHYPTKRVLTHLSAAEKTTERVPISRIRLSHDRSLCAVSGDDRTITFFDVTFLGNDEEVDRLRSKAEARHMVTIRNAAKEDEAAEGNDDDDDSSWTDDDDNESWTDSDEDDDAPAEDVDSDVENRARVSLKRRRGPTAASVDNDPSANNDDDAPADEGEEPELTRTAKRERMAAAKWLKEARKQKVNFGVERRKRRARGFWSDL